MMDASAAGDTVNVVVPLTFPSEAAMVVVPVAALSANPVALMVATVVELELQVAVLVRSCVVESV